MNRSTIRSVGVLGVTLFLSSAAPSVLAQGRGRGQTKVEKKDDKVETKEGTTLTMNQPINVISAVKRISLVE